MVRKKIRFPQGKVTIRKVKGGYTIKIGKRNFDETNQKNSALVKAQSLRVLQQEEKLKFLKRQFKSRRK